ncbi:MAG: hypothetical protein CVV06_16735 [Gammaproteobacteria bacterium HGW-Gammaproteobacteria-10]|nr:MAG: hypothetical protein CVV06_16735 [Gammaproteobacteria bacterium HGW-Gammaproteobacteria-10]
MHNKSFQADFMPHLLPAPQINTLFIITRAVLNSLMFKIAQHQNEAKNGHTFIIFNNYLFKLSLTQTKRCRAS